MDESDDPYYLLGVSPDADSAQIRTAYRKAALKHHPDKQRTEEDKKSATVIFAKISNAYEILSDDEKRKQYDRQQQQPTGGGMPSGFSDFHSDFGQPSSGGFGHPFFSSFRGGFHDPFQVFEQVFREEFGGPMGRNDVNSMPRNSFRRSGMMGDPFMGGGMMGDPFMGGGMMGDPFMGGSMFGGGGRDPFADMFSSMQRQGQQSGNGSNVFYSSTSTSSFGGGSNMGESVSVSTTTRMINGKQQTVTERVVRKADGTVERHVERAGDEDLGLGSNAIESEPRRYLSNGNGRSNAKNEDQIARKSTTKRKRSKNEK